MHKQDMVSIRYIICSRRTHLILSCMHVALPLDYEKSIQKLGIIRKNPIVEGAVKPVLDSTLLFLYSILATTVCGCNPQI